MKKALLLSALFSSVVFAQSTEDRIRQMEEQIRTLQQETEVLKEQLRKLRLEIAILRLATCRIKGYV